MTVELEEKIMSEIGFGQHYNYFNGSGSCEYLRKQAAAKLSNAIADNASGEIVSPNPKLMSVVNNIAQRGDDNQYSLTKTWQAAADTIRAHIDAAAMEPAKRTKYLESIAQELQQQYLPAGVRISDGSQEVTHSSDIEVIGPATARLKQQRAESESRSGGDGYSVG